MPLWLDKSYLNPRDTLERRVKKDIFQDTWK